MDQNKARSRDPKKTETTLATGFELPDAGRNALFALFARKKEKGMLSQCEFLRYCFIVLKTVLDVMC